MGCFCATQNVAGNRRWHQHCGACTPEGCAFCHACKVHRHVRGGNARRWVMRMRNASHALRPEGVCQLVVVGAYLLRVVNVWAGASVRLESLVES